MKESKSTYQRLNKSSNSEYLNRSVENSIRLSLIIRTSYRTFALATIDYCKFDAFTTAQFINTNILDAIELK